MARDVKRIEIVKRALPKVPCEYYAGIGSADIPPCRPKVMNSMKTKSRVESLIAENTESWL